MSAEKMKILQMLESGKITAEDAARLLQSVESPSAGSSRSSASATEPTRNTSYSSSASNSQQRYDSGNFDEYAKEFGKKLETLAKDLEPRLQKFAEVVVEKTATVADRVSKTVLEPTRSVAPSGGASMSSANMTERLFETIVSPGFNELNLSGLNGNVTVRGYNGDKISARIAFKPKVGGAQIDFIRLGNKFYLNYDEDDFRCVAVDALIPESMFTNVTIQTTNGDMEIAGVRADQVLLGNINGKMDIRGIRCEGLKVDNSNGKIAMGDIQCEFSQIENSNEEVRMDSFDIEKMKLSTFNAPVSVTVSSVNRYSEYVWSIETSNGKLSLNTPSAPELGYYLRAQTMLGNVRFGLTGLNYLINEPTRVEAKSIQYDSAMRKIDIELETSNAQIIVN